jgi:uncharacterized protein
VDRIFLDANVLYSAAIKTQSPLHQLWEFRDVELLSSSYAVSEASRNLMEDSPGSLPELEKLTARVLIPDVFGSANGLPADVSLVVKDRPILWAAIQVRATHLLTGDKKHFRLLYGRTIGGVLIVSPNEYFERRAAGAAQQGA